jgi:hypothetical protein
MVKKMLNGGIFLLFLVNFLFKFINNKTGQNNKCIYIELTLFF